MAWLESKIKKLSWLDMALIKLGTLTVGVLLAKLVPSITQVDAIWLLAVAILLVAKPTYKVFRK